MGFISLFLLTACTTEINFKEDPVPTTTIGTPQDQPDTKSGTDNAKEAMAFLKKGEEITSNLETISFLTYLYETTFLSDPEHSFNSYISTYEGIMQRTPKLAHIFKSTDISSGTINDGEYLYDESSHIVYTDTDYFDYELGWFTESGDFSYGGEVTNDDRYIRHEDLDSNFKTLEHIDAFMQLFIAYPSQLSISKEKIEDFDGEIELDNWIIELNLSSEQFVEHFKLFEYNFFTGSYTDVDVISHPFFESEDPKDLYLTLTFDPSYNLVQLTVNYTYQGIKDYVDTEVNGIDHITKHYYTFFSDHNSPYTQSIPEKVIENADYD